MTHVISNDEDVSQLIIHLGVVHGHERRVDDDTHGDEKVDERIHDKQFDGVCEGLPARWTLPVIDQLRTLPTNVVLP